MGKKPTPAPAVQPPVTPLLERLPLADLGWDAFEAFCCALVARLPKVRECQHYGKQGDAQEGIDLFAHFENGDQWAFQNKRMKQFGKAAVAKAVAATSYDADRFIILLSREATAETRKEVAKRPKWAIWDARDISRKVRELPLEDARRLIDDHFGGAVRRAFLGVSAVSTFPTPETYFGQLLDQTKLFNHAWTLVGRVKQLDQLHAFVDSPRHRVAVLSGRGGIGKSKLLHAFSGDFTTRHGNWTIRFVGEELPLTPESLDDLPAAPLVVVVDDAHRREDLGVLLAYAQQREQAIKLLFSCRPQGLDNVNYLLRNTGFDPQQVAQIEPVADLSRDEVRQLAVQVLGEDNEHLADRLTAVTKDCPLVTVVGGRLLVGKKVDPLLLERDDDFRAAALSAYRDVLMGDVGDRIEPGLCRGLLNLLAAVAPVLPENEAFQEAAGTFLSVPPHRIVEAVGVLEQHGIVLRRGYTVRVAPDVLADHLLHDACLTPQGRATGYARQVYQQFGAVCPAQVFRNLAELDWRVRHSTGEETDLLADIWEEVGEAFAGSDNLGRCTMLDLVKEVAYYQPERVLELVEYAVHNPATTPEPEWTSHFHPFTHDHVRRKLPEVIRRVAYSYRHLPRCCDLLWELGRDDDRKLNPYPDHAMRVLTDLAEYDPDKPPGYNQVVLEAAGRWVESPDAHAHLHSPLDVLDPLLAKSGTSVRGQRHGFVMRAFHWSREATGPLREGALKLIQKCLESGEVRVVVRALRSLEEALREPVPYLNMPVTADDSARWTPDRLGVLAVLEDFAARTAQPIFLLRVQEILRAASAYGLSDEVKQRAARALAAIPDSFELRITSLLCKKNHHDLCFPDGDDDDEKPSWQERQERVNAFSRTVASEFITRHPRAEDGFTDLNARMNEVQQSGGEAQPWLLAHAIWEANGAYSDQLCELTLKSPDCPLGGTFGALLAKLRRRDEKRAQELIREAVQGGNLVLCRAVANEYWTQGWLANPSPDDLRVMEDFISHPDFGVKRLALIALPALAQPQPRAAVALALKADVGQNDRLADELCGMFTRQAGGIDPALLTDADVDAVLTKLEAISTLDDHHVHQFLAHAAKRRPQGVVALLLNRIGREDLQPGGGGRALPFDGFHLQLQGLVDSDQYQQFMRVVRDRMLGAKGADRFWLPRLFKELSLNFSPASLQVLGEWVTSGDPGKVEVVGSLVSEASPNFVFEQVGFVTTLLDRASKAGNTCHRRVLCALGDSAKSHSKQGVSGRPFPEDIALRDRAAGVAKSLTPGTPIRRFFEYLNKYAEAQIRDQSLRDEESDD